MAIEGPLKELGLHDIFQLLDLSRKTGVMRVTSQLRNNDGMVAFDSGAIVWAEIRSNPIRLGEMLLAAGRITEADLERALAIMEREKGARRLGQVLLSLDAITERELRRQIEHQISEVVFELLSWREGFFSFNEGPLTGVPTDAMVRIRTESVLMEGARRIDEWSRIEHQVPHLGVVPELAPVESGADVGLLDLLPAEWEVLTLVDGSRDVRGIATALARSEFEVARTIFGLVTTGVIALRDPQQERRRSSLGGDVGALLAAAESRLASGDATGAREAAQAAAALRPGESRVHMLLARAYLIEGRSADAIEEARRAARLDPESSEAHQWYGTALAAAGRFREAGEQFEMWERLADGAVDERLRAQIAAARQAVATLQTMVGLARG